MEKQLWRIDTRYACAAVIADRNGVVETAAPIFHWMVGKRMDEVRRWVLNKKGILSRIR